MDYTVRCRRRFASRRKTRVVELSVAESDRCMSPVAERLVPRRTATAQSDSLARFVDEAIGGDDRDSAAKPDRAAAVFLWILDEADRDRQLGFQRFAGGLVP